MQNHSIPVDKVDRPIYWEQSQKFLKYAASFILAGSLTYLIAISIFTPGEMRTARGVIPILLSVVAIVVRILIFQSKVEASFRVLIVGLWGLLICASYFLGGLHSNAAVIFPLLIIMVGWFLSTRFTVILTLSTMVAGFGFLLAEMESVLPLPPPSHPVLPWIVQSFVLALSAVLITQLVRAYHERLQDVQKLTDDLSQRTATVEANQADLNRAQAIARIGSWVYDIANDEMSFSAEICRILGLPKGVKGNHDTYLNRCHPEDRRTLDLAWQGVLKGKPFDLEHRIIVSNEIFWIRQRAELELDKEGVPLRSFGTTQDITERKMAEDRINSLAFYDPLTLLPNRRLLKDRLQQALASSSRNGRAVAILFIDLDNFKVVNDTLGHGLGDLLLQQAAVRLTSCVRKEDTVACIGGDEFVVMLEDLNEDASEAATQTETIGEKIRACLNRSYQIVSHECHSTCSIGLTLFNDRHQSPDELLKQADIAMYQAKKAGRNTMRFFDPQMQEIVTARATLENELRLALENQQFQLYYQIQKDSGLQAIGAEALIRWNHPERGLVLPDQFITLAEETGLILPIGQWVLDTACAQLKTWEQGEPTRKLVVAVNVSSKEFLQVDFVAQVQATIQRYAIDPKRLKLELTESLLLENIEDTVAIMNALNDIGIQFSLDDFGTGYSSLQYLKRLPFDQVKIDQSFVRDLAMNGDDRAIVRTIIAMAKSLNLDVIAEGVETEEQLHILQKKGCTYFQGYLFGKPIPIGQFDAQLKKWTKQTS